jgi:hypothetical protein
MSPGVEGMCDWQARGVTLSAIWWMIVSPREPYANEFAGATADREYEASAHQSRAAKEADAEMHCVRWRDAAGGRYGWE